MPGAGRGGGRKRGSPSAAGDRGEHPEALGPLAGGAWRRLGACARSVGGRGAQGRDAARPGRPAARDALGPPATPRGMVSPGRPLPAGTRQAASLLRLGLLLLPPLLRGSGAQKGERASGRASERNGPCVAARLGAGCQLCSATGAWHRVAKSPFAGTEPRSFLPLPARRGRPRLQAFLRRGERGAAGTAAALQLGGGVRSGASRGAERRADCDRGIGGADLGEKC